MKKLEKLVLVTQNVRSLTDDQLGLINGGGGAQPTTTVEHRHSAAAIAAPCRLTGGVHTAPCRYTA